MLKPDGTWTLSIYYLKLLMLKLHLSRLKLKLGRYLEVEPSGSERGGEGRGLAIQGPQQTLVLQRLFGT